MDKITLGSLFSGIEGFGCVIETLKKEGDIDDDSGGSDYREEKQSDV